MDRYITKEKPFYKSKKWLTAIIAAIVPILNTYTGLNLEVSEVLAVVLPLVAYVIAQGRVDAEH